MNENEKSVENLNQLLGKNFEAEHTYKKAAENIESIVLKNFFLFQAAKRAKFGTELATEILGLGGDPVKSGSTLEALKDKWLDVINAVSKNNEEVILKTCLAADKENLEEYNSVLKAQHPKTSASEMLEQQKKSIETTLTKIKNLEDVTIEFGEASH